MADFTFNGALGKVLGYHDRVVANDPASCALVVVVLAASGLETDAVLRDKDSLADIVSGTTNEVTNGGYGRKVLTDADLTASAVDDANNRNEGDLPDQTFAAIAAGDAWAKVLICFDRDTTSGTDSDIVPLTAHDYAATPDGTDLIIRIAAAGYFRAS